MNAVELFNREGKSVGVWYCGKCKIMARTLDDATQCCTPNRCACGADCKRYYTMCENCQHEKRVVEEQEKFDKAEKVTQWDGWVYSSGHGSEYFKTVDDLLEYLEDSAEGDEPVTYAWTCTENRFVNARIEDIEQRIADNAYEDFEFDTLAGVERLKAEIEAFNEANAKAFSYSPNFKKAVLIQNKLAKPLI